MARENGVNVEYRPADTRSSDPGTASNHFVKAWGSRLRALESAVDDGNKVAFVEYGETLDDAIARELAARKPKTVGAAVKAGEEFAQAVGKAVRT